MAAGAPDSTAAERPSRHVSSSPLRLRERAADVAATLSHLRLQGRDAPARLDVAAVLVPDPLRADEDFDARGSGGSSRGKPLVAWSVEALARIDAVRQILVAVPDGRAAPRGSVAVPCGEDLIATLEGALATVAPCQAVIVHDPRRPLATPEIFVRALLELHEHHCDAVVAATPVTDTLKRADSRGRGIETVDRNQMWEVQTPQAYHLEAVRAALARARAHAGRVGHALLPTFAPGRVRVIGLPRESLRVERAAEARVAEILLQQTA